MSAGTEAIRALREAIWANGFRPMAVHTAKLGNKDSGKNPLGDKWQIGAKKDPPEIIELGSVVPYALNTGVLCDGLRVIDFDIDDAAMVNKAADVAFAILGVTMLRIRSNSPRCMAVYKAAEGEPRKLVSTGATHSKEVACKIEVLGRGQQFVAYGQHWSGAELQWPGGGPADQSIDNIPVVTDQQVMAFLAACAPIIDAVMPTPPKPPKANGHDTSVTADQGDLFAALKLTPNTGAPDWEAWNAVGMAIWASTEGSAQGWAMWRDWSAKNPADDPEATLERWEHYGKSPPTQTGAGKIFAMVTEASPGWRKPSILKAKAQAPYTDPQPFPNIPPPPIPDDAPAEDEPEEEDDADPVLNEGPDGPDPPTPETDPAEEARVREEIDAIPPDDVLNSINEMRGNVTRWMITALFNKKYMVVNEGGKALVMWEAFDPVMKRYSLERATFDDFKKFFSNRTLTVQVPIPNGVKNVTKNYAEWWLADPGRRQFIGGVTFAPGSEPIPHTLNLWQGWNVVPKEGDWSLMSDHIDKVICAGRGDISTYVLKWLARMVQFPAEPGEVAIVVRGLKGIGKGMFGKWLLRMCGQHGLHIINPTHLTGRFTGHLRDVIFVLADEAFFAGDKEHERILKGIITEDRLLMEAKYRTAVDAANMLHLMMFSNEDWVIPATHDERRYLMLNATADKIGDRKYFEALDAQMANGGLAAMLHDLLNMDLGDFHPRKVPDTPELAEQKLHSLDSVYRWWAAVLTRGFVWKSRWGHKDFMAWDDFYTTQLLLRSYTQWCGENKVHYPAHETLLGKRLSAIYPRGKPRAEHPVYERDSLDKDENNPVVRAGNIPGYKVGDLDKARAEFSKALGREIGMSDWDGPTDGTP